jgi:hypothetical protein
MQGKELEHHNLWRDVCRQAKTELADPELRAKWEERFYAQLPSTKGSTPDQMAPLNPTTGTLKRYVQLYAFTRAMIYQELKAQNPENS